MIKKTMRNITFILVFVLVFTVFVGALPSQNVQAATKWTNITKKTVKGSSNFEDTWSKTVKASYSTVNYGYTSTTGIKTYYTDTWSRYKHRSISKCCSSDGTVKKSKITSAQSAYHWIAADITTLTKYKYAIFKAQRTGELH